MVSITEENVIKGKIPKKQSIRGMVKDIPSIDNTLTKEGYAADAKAVGDALSTKASTDHKHTASEVGARPSTWTPTAEEVGARPNTWMPTAYEVGARPNNWMPTASDVGAAPSGYGLGAGCSSIASVKSITKNGWYHTNGDTPDGGYWLCHARCTNDAYNIVVDAWSADGKYHAKLTKNGTWEDEWEWVNPPLNLDVPYKTTERWYSYPVYIKMIDMEALPNNDVKTEKVYDNPNGGRILSVTGHENSSGQCIPTDCFGTVRGKSIGVGFGADAVYLSTNFDGSAYTQAMLTVKYIKY